MSLRLLTLNIEGDRHLDRIAALYRAGVIRPPEVTLYKLSEAIEAQRLSEARHVRGKLVFKVR